MILKMFRARSIRVRLPHSLIVAKGRRPLCTIERTDGDGVKWSNQTAVKMKTQTSPPLKRH